MNAPPSPQLWASLRPSADGDPPSDALTRAERALRRWELAFEGAAAGQLLLDEHARIQRVNAEAVRLLGLSREMLLSLPVVQQAWTLEDRLGRPIPPGSFPGNRALSGEEPLKDAVFRLTTPGVTRRWISVTATILPTEPGPNEVMLSITDVSCRIDGEQSRTLEWQQMMDIIQRSRLGLWHSDPWEQTLFLDEQAAQLLGIPPGLSPELTTQAWAQAIHPDDQARVRAVLREHLKGVRSSSVTECRILKPDGQWRWIRTRSHTLQNPANGRTAKLAGTVEDVTELKGAEAAVQHGQDLLQALFTHAPIGIQLLDLQANRTVNCNQALADITGTSIETILSHGPDERTSPHTAARRVKWRRDLLTRGSTGPHEFSVRRGPDEWREVRMSAVRVFDPHGQPFAWAVVQDITENKAYEAQLKTAATCDRLTGMPNRAAMLSHLHELLQLAASEPRSGFAVLFLDVDRFKLVNDTLGHAVGDELLCEVADRLRSLMIIHPGGVAARFGGDEFVLTVQGIGRAEQLQAFTQRLIDLLSPVYLINGHELHSSASVGVTLSGGRHVDAETLLREADIAMYEAKRRGRAQVTFFGPEMDAHLQRSVLIENGLRHAITRGQLSVAYQPIVDLNDRRMISAEALVRWRHPVLGPVSPAEFIPVAEESGHILAIGEWVLRESCVQWLAWRRSHPDLCPVTVSVNLSRVQLAQGQRLISMVKQVLQDTGMQAANLQLEVTEREVMGQQYDMAALLGQLHALGIKLAMDDFGTGASSLGSLRELPFDVIKIDKSFMADLSRDMQALAIAQATIHVIENIGMRSVAEGVENAEDVSVLQALGCQYGQGYLFCKPVPGDQLIAAWH
jgi:diguanylate cyclase (GGDEF)-like protein/PAS domain S-box-containing protein